MASRRDISISDKHNLQILSIDGPHGHIVLFGTVTSSLVAAAAGRTLMVGGSGLAKKIDLIGLCLIVALMVCVITARSYA